MNCPRCQHTLRDTASFCDRCGLDVRGHAPQQPQPPGPVSEPTQPSAPPDPLVGHVIDSKYEVLARLGEGGMGAVYRARRRLIGDDVAVKVLLPRYVSDAEMLERFRREARAAAMLHHPNVVTIFDYGEARGEESFAYIVMELLEGESLRDVLRRDGRLAPARALRLLFETCAGVGAAHRRHVLHRDLKPDNIIVLPSRDDWQHETVKVVDFGIAKLRDLSGESTLTVAGSVMGTPHYMSPEQCRGESLDPRADVYSLGVILYEMLAGVPPYVATTPTGVIAKHLTEPPPRLPPHLGLPSELEQTIARALAKDPAARHSDAVELAREVQSRISMLQSPEQAAAVSHLLPQGAPPLTPAPGANLAATRRETPPDQGNGSASFAQLPPTSLDPRGGQAFLPTQAPPPRSRAGLYTFLAVAAVLLGAAAAVGALFYSGLVKFDWGEETATGGRGASPTPTAAPTPTPQPSPVTQSFANNIPIEIPSSGSAAPYPSTIEVNNMPGRVRKVTVRIHNVSHSLLSDLTVVLVAPSGENLVLCSRVPGSYRLLDTTLGFEDNAPHVTATVATSRRASYVTQQSPSGNRAYNTNDDEDEDENVSNSNTPTTGKTIIPSGVYRPTGPKGSDSAIPGVTTSTATSLAVFQRSTANGPWKLYVYDHVSGDSGRIAGGWSLSLTVDPSAQPAASVRSANESAALLPAPQLYFMPADGRAALPSRRRTM